MPPLVTFSQFRFPAGARFWAFRQMGVFARSMRDIPGLAFWKLLGTGARFGGATPDWRRYAFLGVWDDASHADTFWTGSEVMTRYRARAESSITHRLLVTRSNGSWDGQRPFGQDAVAPSKGPVAVLTRAALRPSRQLVFWRYATAVEPEIARASGLVSALSIGELPILRSGTFSVWEGAEALQAFVRQPAHLEALRARSSESLYTEELFARFSVLGTDTEGH